MSMQDIIKETMTMFENTAIRNIKNAVLHERPNDAIVFGKYLFVFNDNKLVEEIALYYYAINEYGLEKLRKIYEDCVKEYIIDENGINYIKVKEDGEISEPCKSFLTKMENTYSSMYDLLPIILIFFGIPIKSLHIRMEGKIIFNEDLRLYGIITRNNIYIEALRTGINIIGTPKIILPSGEVMDLDKDISLEELVKLVLDRTGIR